MLGLSATWFFGIRHALVAMALLATLASGFDFHFHVSGNQEQGGRSHVLGGEPACTHDCSAINVTSEAIEQGVGDWDAEPDHDQCGHCHCQISTSDLPSSTKNPTRSDHIVQLLTPCDGQLRVGVTYQPDPPPVLG